MCVQVVRHMEGGPVGIEKLSVKRKCISLNKYSVCLTPDHGTVVNLIAITRSYTNKYRSPLETCL